MTFSEKIDEWIKEAETRPGSALMILKLIAGRMRDLSERNEELASENITLQDGSRVKEYQERIAYLEFQLELLKRRFGAEEVGSTARQPVADTLSLLIYSAQGRILRMPVNESELPATPNLGYLRNYFEPGGEPPRLLAVPSTEEVLLLFSSGRVGTYRVADVPVLPSGSQLDLGQATIPDAPHAGEKLVCLMPLSHLPVSDFFLQASRRGSVKKTLHTIFEKVLSTHYLGRGAVQKNDQAFLVMLAEKKARLALVTYEGHILYLEADGLAFSAEERIHMELTDRIIAAFVPGANDWVVCLTQNGKILQRESASFEIAKAPGSRGQPLIPPSRLEQGTRFVGATACQAVDWLLTLDGQGKLSAWLLKDACGAGALRTESEFISIGLIPSLNRQGAKA